METKMVWRVARWALLAIILTLVFERALVAQAKPQAMIWTVDNSGDDGTAVATNCNAGNVDTCRLRDAIATASGGDTINFAADYTIGLVSSQLDISKDLAIDGTGHAITISGQNSVRVIDVNSGYTLNLNTLTVTNGKIWNNCGGGIFNLGSLYVTNTTLSNNHSDYYGYHGGGSGGGICNDGISYVTNSAFIGNFADGGAGGGISNSGTLTVTNSTFSGNHANWYLSSGFGGGIFNDGTANVTNSTFSNNTSSSGEGVWNLGTVTFRNTILEGGNCSNLGTITDGGNNLEDTNDCGFGATSLINTNPQLGALTGSPAYFPLNYNSPAIDAGNATACAASPVNGLDQRGKPRNDLQCDIGAYEMQISDSNSTTLTPVSGGIMRTFGPPLAGIQVIAGSTGAVTITKVTNWTLPQPSNAIKAWWDITPTNASGWTANLELCYFDSTELNGLTAANLHLWRYNGSIWSDMGRSSASGNCVQVNGITGFSRWTLATDNPGISRFFPIILR